MIMATYVNRQIYLQKLIHRRDNGEVKIITGTRRCGKPGLLKKVFHDYLVSQGVPKQHIIMVADRRPIRARYVILWRVCSM